MLTHYSKMSNRHHIASTAVGTSQSARKGKTTVIEEDEHIPDTFDSDSAGKKNHEMKP